MSRRGFGSAAAGSAVPVTSGSAGRSEGRGRAGRRAASSRDRWPRTLRVVATGSLLAVVIVAVGLVVLRPGGSPAAVDPETAAGAAVAVGTAIGQRAPDFRLTALDGRTVTRESLSGGPALLWFTTSYCVPCQEGAKRLQRVLDETGSDGRVAVVMVFVDPSEPASALEWWRSAFGRPDWTYGLADQDMIAAYRLQYLDSKYLLDSDGVVRAADFFPLNETEWARHLRSVVGS